MPYRFRCRCSGQPPRWFEFESPHGDWKCPRCGREGPTFLVPLIDVHFIVLDPKGPLVGAFGRQHVACTPDRAHLAAHQFDDYAATDDPREVTCPRCKGTKAWREMAKLFPELLAPSAPGHGGVQIAPGG